MFAKIEETKEIRDAFLRDHRLLTRGFSQMVTALRDGDLGRAAEIADELDRSAGAHVAFEEELLYPLVEQARGQEYTSRLYREHEVALQTVRSLLSYAEDPSPRLDIDQLLNGARTAVVHAVSCGSLLSHLTSLPREGQQRMLQRLRELEEQSPRWTDLQAADE